MRFMIALLLVVGLASSSCAQVAQSDGTSVRQFPRYPILVVRNETPNAVRVYDQGFLIANVGPMDTAITVLPGRGSRALTLRSLGSESSTEVFTFETNRGWTLTIDHNGRNWLGLRP